jgi:hydrogenase maturation protease
VTGRVLVAGVGNVFLGDDGFGVEVARRLAGEDLPEGVRVEDFGIRGVHLAYEMLEGYDTVILVDATPRGGEPGTLYVIEPDVEGAAARAPIVKAGESPLIDAHGMEPDSVFALVKVLEGRVGRVLVVGCEPAEVTERMGLSDPVAASVDRAAELVKELVRGRPPAAPPGKAGGGGASDGKEGNG